jgi:REP element-mobilizing transposase RayT
MAEQWCFHWFVEGKRAQHSTYNINHHFVWCPKYRRWFYEEAGWREREDAAPFVRDLSASSQERT